MPVLLRLTASPTGGVVLGFVAGQYGFLPPQVGYWDLGF